MSYPVRAEGLVNSTALSAITAFLSRFPRLLNRGPGGPASLGHFPQSSIFSPTLLMTNWLNFLCSKLYNSSTSTFFLWASQIAFIQPVHGQGCILIFLDRMQLLFTQVLFLILQPGQVGGQYTTIYLIYIYKEDLALRNLQWLISHKNQLKKSYVFNTYVWRGFGIT